MTDNLGTPPIPLTPTQLDCRRVIDELTVAVGHVPSYETIRHEMGWRSKSQVARHVRIRTDKRWLRHARGRQYSLEVVFPPSCIPDYGVRITPDGEAHLAAVRGRRTP